MIQNKEAFESRYQNLQNILTEMESVLVAFSGGVDSTFLLRVAKDLLGNNVLAVTALSETTPRRERDDAGALAEIIGVSHHIIHTHELEIPEFVRNPEDRCYICKKNRFFGLSDLAREKSLRHVADGGNSDDHRDYRPGIRAVRELGIRSPLSEAGLSKADIRILSKKLGLSTWDKPAYACLATRIPYHSPITPEKLRQADEGEEYIRSLGIIAPSGQVRVRHYGETARIETEPEIIPNLAEQTTRNQLVNYFRSLGFEYVTLDLGGYSMGSMNRGLSD